MGGRGGSSGGGGSKSGYGSGSKPNLSILPPGAGKPDKIIFMLPDDDDPSIPSARKQKQIVNIRREERDIKGMDHEFMVVTDRQGRTIYRIEGKAHSVAVDGGTSADITKRGTIISHNHPSGSSFSFADFIFASHRGGEHEIRAIGPEHTHSMRPAVGKTWLDIGQKPTPTGQSFLQYASQKHEAAVQRAFTKYDQTVQKMRTEGTDFGKQAGKGQQSARATQKRYLDAELHKSWKEIAKVGGFEYRRESTRQRPEITHSKMIRRRTATRGGE